MEKMKLSKAHSKKITKIKQKYNFDEQFDLLGRLNYLPTLITSYPSHARNSEIKKQIKALKEAAMNLSILLADSSQQTKDRINQLPLISNEVKGISPTEMNPDWQLSQFEKYLDMFWVTCMIQLQKIPADKGGRQESSIPKFIILLLSKFYKDGTNKKPTCGWTDSGDDTTSGAHVGDFYEFILDVKPFLQVIDIELGTNNTIGGYCIQVLKKYRAVL